MRAKIARLLPTLGCVSKLEILIGKPCNVIYTCLCTRSTGVSFQWSPFLSVSSQYRAIKITHLSFLHSVSTTLSSSRLPSLCAYDNLLSIPKKDKGKKAGHELRPN